jgi:hypothetical protein
LITNSILGVIVGIALVTTLVLQQAEALAEGHELSTKVPSAMSGDNIYIAWWTNKTGNDEVMFRVSNDAGGTFGDKINLSNTTTTDSQDVEIAADGSNVVVTWWERNQTSNEPAARISTDDGLTFGPILKLSTNGSVGANVEQE